MEMHKMMKSMSLYGLLAITAQTSIAATSTASLPVRATVLSTCSVIANPLYFSTNLPTSILTDSLASTTISVNCPIDTPYSVIMGVGSSPGATKSSRKMVSNGNFLNYNLFTNNTYTTVWSDTLASPPDSTTHQNIGQGTTQIIPIYGKVLANQTPAPGAYADTVTITVIY